MTPKPRFGGVRAQQLRPRPQLLRRPKQVVFAALCGALRPWPRAAELALDFRDQKDLDGEEKRGCRLASTERKRGAVLGSTTCFGRKTDLFWSPGGRKKAPLAYGSRKKTPHKCLSLIVLARKG